MPEAVDIGTWSFESYILAVRPSYSWLSGREKRIHSELINLCTVRYLGPKPRGK